MVNNVKNAYNLGEILPKWTSSVGLVKWLWHDFPKVRLPFMAIGKPKLKGYIKDVKVTSRLRKDFQGTAGPFYFLHLSTCM